LRAVKVYRTVIDERRLEIRITDWGAEQVLLDGRVVSRKRFAGFFRPSHFIEVEGANGVVRHVEVRRIDLSKLGLGRYRMIVTVDGVDRSHLAPVDPRAPLSVCPHCGYRLVGQPVERDEVRCPECGRHTPAAVLGLDG
jgi:DNA-directed RNA polymerase subunit RPC12/RpoP